MRFGSMLLTLEDFSAVLARIPAKGAEGAPTHAAAFASITRRVVAVQPRLSAARRARILAFVEQFKSYSPESEEDGKGVVDAARMLRFMKVYASRPEKLAAINIHFAQKALALLQTEHNLKRRRGKPAR